MKIRRARLSDFKAVHKLLDQLIRGSPDRRKPMWEKLMRAEDYAAWIVELDGRPVGFLDLFILPDVAHGANVGLINNLVIDERFRGQGLGERLLREAIEYGRREALVELHLWTEFSNKQAIGLYKKSGFRERSLLMELELSP